MLLPRPIISRVALAGICTLGLLCNHPAAAQTTIGTTLNGEQANTDFGGGDGFYGQVFTVPAGSVPYSNVLNSFSVQVGDNGPLTNFSLYAFNLTTGFSIGNAAGTITGSALYSSGPVAGVTVPTGRTPYTALEDTYQIGGLTLTPGGTYLALIQNITPTPTQPGAPIFFDSSTAFQHYPGYNYDPSGAFVVSGAVPGSFYQGFTGSDLAFRASFGPAAVPESSTTISFGQLLALGLGSLVIIKKKARA